MVYINDQKINILPNDTKQTFLIKVSSKFNTLPQYLYFPKEIDLKAEKETSYKTENLLDILKIFENNISFSEFFDYVKKKFPNISTLELVQLWISFNKVVPTDPIYILSAQQEIDTLLEDIKFDIDKFLEMYKDEFLSTLKIRIKKNVDESSKQTDILKRLKETSFKEYSDFEFEKVTLEINTNIEGMNLDQVFDHLKTNSFIPFITYNNYYKILENFKPDDSFLLSNENIIICKLIITPTIPQNLNLTKDFGNCFIVIRDNKLVLNISADSKVLSKSKNELIQRLLNTFIDLDIEIISVDQRQVSGIYFIADTSINKIIFSDLVMNHNILSNFLGIDESQKISKKKTGVYIYFTDPLHPELGEVRASIVPKVAQKSDLEIRDKDRSIFPYNSEIIRVKISRADNIEAVNNFQKIFSQLLGIYGEEEERIFKIYKKYIPTFKLEDKDKKQIKPMKEVLKDKASDLFLPKYSRVCQKKPSIIDPEEVEEFEEKNYQVMLFPKDGEEGTQYYYICDHKKRKYPGLSLNTLSNRDKYPYVPCCFKVDQINKNESYYKEYYYGEKMQEGEQQRIITTNKFAQPNKVGTIPKNLEILFKIYDDNFEYIRKGVYRSKNSFLECVLDGIGDKKFIKLDITKKLEYITKLKKELVNMNLNICRQECYDLSDEQIKKMLQDPESYLDPKMFIRLLETKFKVNIYLFSRDYGNENGKMIIPRHIQGYFYHPKQYDKTILIYEHLGNERDRAEYPQCELILQWYKQEGENVTYSIFDANSPFIQGVNSLFELINKNTYLLDIPNLPINFTIPKNLIESQFIDQFGKVRALKLRNGFSNISLFTSPLPPFDVKKEEIDFFLNENSYEEIKKFNREFEVNSLQQTITNNRLTGIIGYSGNVQISFKISPSEKLKNIPETNINILTVSSSLLERFIQDKKISNYLVQNFIYYYSGFINENNLEANNNSILKFVKERVNVDTSFRYNKTSSDFAKKLIVKGGKLIINSDETLKRLIFILRKTIVQNKNKIKNYYKAKFVDDYYNDLDDFQKYPFEVLIYSKERVQKYITQPKIDSTLYQEVQIGKTNPYFILIKNQVFLAQAVEDQFEAIYKGKIWSERGFNTQEISENDENLEATVYIFNSIDNVTIKEIGDIENGYDINTLVYKRDGEIRWVSLLKV